MQKETEVYSVVQTGTGDDAEQKVLPEARVEGLKKKGTAFEVIRGPQNCAIYRVESDEELVSLIPDTEIRMDIINRGLVLRQQQLIRAELLADDFSATEELDVRDGVATKSERRPVDKVKQTDNLLERLAKENPEALQALLAKHGLVGSAEPQPA